MVVTGGKRAGRVWIRKMRVNQVENMGNACVQRGQAYSVHKEEFGELTPLISQLFFDRGLSTAVELLLAAVGI